MLDPRTKLSAKIVRPRPAPCSARSSGGKGLRHHEEVAPTSPYAMITHLADAISAARPGARKEKLGSYVKRLEDLELIAASFEGVKKAYALQAGREIRIIVNEDRLSDEDAMVLARDIALKVEEQLDFPGQIKVTVIREKRAIEYAK